MRPQIDSHICGVVGLLFAIVGAFSCGAYAGDFDTDVSPAVVLEDRYPERRTQFPGGVTGVADIVYSVVPGFRPMVLDLYLPPHSDSAPTAFPVVLYVHGGGWMSGHTRHSGAFANWPKTLASIASNGYVVASVEYRLSGEARFPAAFRDIQNAIRWLRSNASEYVIDKNRFVVWGGSAGGQLAALAATACGDLQWSGSSWAQVTEDSDETDPGQHRESACVQGAVSWYGVLDIAGLLRTSAVETADRPVPVVIARYLGCEPTCNTEIVAAASPLEHVDSRDPPMLLIHGTGDAVVPVSQSERMQQVMWDAGAQAKLITIPGVGHSFIGASPSETIAASQLAFAETMSFIEQAVGRNPKQPR